MGAKTRVFYTPDCPHCFEVKETCKRLAEEHGVEYEEVDASAPSGFVELLMVQSTTVPTVVVGERTLRANEISESKLREAIEGA